MAKRILESPTLTIETNFFLFESMIMLLRSCSRQSAFAHKRTAACESTGVDSTTVLLFCNCRQQPFGREVTGGRPKVFIVTQAFLCKSTCVHLTQRINQGPSRKIIAHQPGKEEKVELRKAENKWVRHSETEKEKDKEIPDEDKETAEIFRKFQGILNKLTPQKFKDLAEQALKLPLLTVERLKGCIDKIFTKVNQIVHVVFTL